jgi:hypothetical protein
MQRPAAAGSGKPRPSIDPAVLAGAQQGLPGNRRRARDHGSQRVEMAAISCRARLAHGLQMTVQSKLRW